MKYSKFNNIWNSISSLSTIKSINASKNTIKALIEYGKGNKNIINNVRKFLNAPLT